jgi:CheY-like chemotaxis protein
MAMSLRKILLVEDNPNDVELILEALEEYHVANSIEVAVDGEEALDYLYRRGKFAGRSPGNPLLILLDLKLPKVDGLEVLKIIKTDNQLKLMPVVMLSSSSEEKDLLECYTLGVNAYVVKPVAFHDFIEAIKGLGLFWVIINETPLG